MSPNDFGIYVGTIYASYWNPEIGFDGSSKPIPPVTAAGRVLIYANPFENTTTISSSLE